jgi:lipopolysaccharide export system permease protein
MTLNLYLLRRFFATVGLVTLVFIALLFPIDLMEQVRRLDQDGGGLRDGFRLASLNLPAALYQILPLIVILSTLALLVSLARSSELVAIRASGRSGMSALVAPIGGAFLLGLFGLGVLNPIVAATQSEYERVSDTLRNGVSSVLSLSPEGVWLRQGDGAGQTVIRAARSSLDGTVLFDATFLQFDAEGSMIARIDASRARLAPVAPEGSEWRLQNAKSWPLGSSRNPERDASLHPTLKLPSTLTQAQIRDSFGVPSAIPIYELPSFINQLNAAGFSGLQHRVWLAMELTSPVMLMAMVLIGAGFSMGHARAGGVGKMVLIALIVGFGIFFLRSFAQVLGENGQLSVQIAAWAPPLAAICVGLGVLLHREEG